MPPRVYSPNWLVSQSSAKLCACRAQQQLSPFTAHARLQRGQQAGQQPCSLPLPACCSSPSPSAQSLRCCLAAMTARTLQLRTAMGAWPFSWVMPPTSWKDTRSPSCGGTRGHCRDGAACWCAATPGVDAPIHPSHASVHPLCCLQLLRRVLPSAHPRQLRCPTWNSSRSSSMHVTRAGLPALMDATMPLCGSSPAGGRSGGWGHRQRGGA